MLEAYEGAALIALSVAFAIPGIYPFAELVVNKSVCINRLILSHPSPLPKNMDNVFCKSSRHRTVGHILEIAPYGFDPSFLNTLRNSFGSVTKY